MVENKFDGAVPLVLLVLSLASDEEGNSQPSTVFLASASTPSTSAQAGMIQHAFDTLVTKLKSDLGLAAFMYEWQQGLSPDFATTLQKFIRHFEYLLDNSDSDGGLPLRVIEANQHLLEPLTVRELEVLHLLNRGFRNRDIAKVICVTENTVKKHLYHIYDKLMLNKRSRTQAILKARDLNIL